MPPVHSKHLGGSVRTSTKLHKLGKRKIPKKQLMLSRKALVEEKHRIDSDVAFANGKLLTVKNDDEKDNYDYLTQGDPAQPLNWRLVANDDAYTLIPINSFYRQQRGLENYQLLGEEALVKKIDVRVECRFPCGEIFPKIHGDTTTMYRNMMIQDPEVKIYAIFGWIETPINAPLGPVSGGINKALDSWTQADIKSYISNNLQPYFDQAVDKLSFREKDKMNIKIEKYVRLKPNLDGAIATQAVAGKVMSADTGTGTLSNFNRPTGSIPTISRSHTFTVNKKVLYTEGYPADEYSGATDYQNLGPYQGDTKIPFCILYSPGFGAMDAVQHETNGSTNPPEWPEVPTTTERRTQNFFVRFNTRTRYTDS